MGWDDPASSAVEQAWLEWRQELGLLVDEHIPRCYRKWRLHTGSCMASLMHQKQGMLELYTFVLWTLLVASTPLLSWQRQRWHPSRGSLYLTWNSVEHFTTILQHCQEVFSFPSEEDHRAQAILVDLRPSLAIGSPSPLT